MENLIIVSACLAGKKCRWDGTMRPCGKVIRLVREGKAIAVCPEELGGLPTPREPAEQQGDRVVTKSGKDVTAEFGRGARETLRIAKENGCTEAILKSRSPSCGSGKVYSGDFDGKLVDGDGVTAKLLQERGIPVSTEEADES